MTRRMRAQARHQLALDALRRWLATFHRIAHVRVEHRDQRLLMLAARQVRINDRNVLQFSAHETLLSSL